MGNSCVLLVLQSLKEKQLISQYSVQHIYKKWQEKIDQQQKQYTFEDSDFHHKWPPLNDQEIIQRIYLKAKTLNSSDSIFNQIITYFTQLKDEIIKKIDVLQKKVINQAEQMPFGREQILRKYQEISQIKKLRELLISDQNTSFDLYQQLCKEFIQQIQLQKDRNTQLFQDLLDQCDKIQDLVNFDKLNEQKQIILEYLDNLSVFDDKIDIQTKFVNLQNRSNEQQSDQNFKIEKLMELISNKSNYCSDEFLNQIKQQLSKMSIFFDKISFDRINQQNKKPIRFQDLNDEKINDINEYVEHYVKIKENPLYLQSVKSSNRIESLQNILNNEFNFLTKNYRESLSEYLIETLPFQKKIDNNLVHSEKGSFDCVRNLKGNDITQLVKLIQKQQNFKNQVENFRNSQSIRVQEFILTKFSFNQNQLENTIKQFPIFDLLIPKQISILNELKLLKGNFCDGNQRLQIVKNINNEFEITLNDGYKGQFQGFGSNCVSSVLERDKKYIFRIQCLNQKYIRIGLMQNKNIHTKFGYADQMNVALFELKNNKIQYLNGDQQSYGSYGISKFIKGNNQQLFDENTILELRVCLSEQKLEVLDYPFYNIQVELEDQVKKNLLQDDLCLFINVYSNQSKYILKEAFIVDQF